MLQRKVARVLMSSLLASCWVAGSGHGAELVDVRIDQRDGGTRVVLELDSPAGYRLERTAMKSANSNGELVIAIDAGASERTVEAAGSLVEEVTIFEGGSDPTMIRLLLSEPGLQVKDSVLVNPPRLILSVSRQSGRPGALPRATSPAAPAPTARTPKSRPAATVASTLREVRVGSHPKFSRLVFELDSPTDYRVTHPGKGSAPELIVTLNASADARNIRSKSRHIESVAIEKSSQRTTARVRLRAGNLRVKEIVLANPDRIVLDVTAN